MIKGAVESLIQRLKQDTSYTLDKAVSDRVLLQLLRYRGVSCMRGCLSAYRFDACQLPLFLGSRVTILHPQLLTIGRSVIIEDNVTIDTLSHNGVKLGNNVTIAKHTVLQCTGVIRNVGWGLKIGHNSAIGAFSFIGAQGGITIGNNVIVGPRVNMHAENHSFQETDRPIRLQGETRQGIKIDDDCWIGAASIILDGVHIARGAVIGAGSIVTGDIPANAVAVGSPARVIKYRAQKN